MGGRHHRVEALRWAQKRTKVKGKARPNGGKGVAGGRVSKSQKENTDGSKKAAPGKAPKTIPSKWR